jgi:ABC-type multidrug transport system fused ATPase/permease subunit
MKLFKRLCKEFIEKHKTLFSSFIIISSISYIMKVIVTPMIYSNIMDLKDNNFYPVIKQIFALWLLTGVIYIVKARMENFMFPEFLSFIRQKLFVLFLEKNKTNFNDSSVAYDITRIFESTRYMKDLFFWFSQYLIPVSILIICINSYFVYKIPLMGAVNIASTSTIIYYIVSHYEGLIENSTKRETHYMELIKKVDENFSNLMNIYINNQIDETIDKNSKLEHEYTDANKVQNTEVMKFTNAIKLTNYFFTFICLCILYIHAKRSNNESSKKEFVTILLMFTFYISTIETIAEDIPFYMMTLGNVRYAEPFLENAIFSNTREKYIPQFQGNIVFDHVSFRYDNKSKYILDDFSLNIKKGERIGIMGQTGKGKSTIIKLLLQFYKPDKGTIYLDGMNSNDINVDDIRKNINYINQKTVLFNDTIIANMKYGNDSTDKDIISLLLEYDLLHVFTKDKDENKNTDILSTMVEKNGANISTGMQKVIFIVRGVLKKCKVIIFDEPFSGIDQDTRQNVLRLIDEKTKGKTTIVITHDFGGLENILDNIIEL